MIKINPTQLGDSKHNKILYHFLMQNKDKNYFVKDFEYKVTLNNKKYSFTLTHDILHRKRESDVNQDRFEVVANQPKVDNGGFGEIIKFEGTLVPTPDETLIFKNKIQRIDKKQNFDTAYCFEYWDIANKEKNFYNLANPAIGAKKPVLVTEDGEISTHMPMHLLTGKNLHYFLYENPMLTVDDRLKLSISLLRAYQEQAHDNEIVHVDGKPPNLFVDPKTLEITILDFGLSVKKGEEAYEGTAPYADPTQEKQSANESHDLHAIGMMIGEIWHKCYPAKINAKWFMQSSQHEFDKLPLAVSHKQSIEKVFSQMTLSDATKRMTSSVALEEFQQIRLSRAAGNDVAKKILLIRANKAGERVRNAYRESRKNKTDGDFKNILSDELDSIKQVDTNKEALTLNEFVETLGIKAFRNLGNKEEIIEKFEQIKIDYSNHVIALRKLRRQVEDFSFNQELTQHVLLLKSEIKRVLNKENKYNVFNVDSMAMLNAKFTDYEAKFADDIKKLEKTNCQITEAKNKVKNLTNGCKNQKEAFEALYAAVDSLPKKPTVIRAFATKLKKHYPKFANLEIVKSRKKLIKRILLIEYEKAINSFGKIAEDIKNPNKPFQETTILIQNTLTKLPNDKSILKRFVNTINHPLFNDSVTTNNKQINNKLDKKTLQERVNNFSTEAASACPIVYKANAMKKLSEQLQPNNRFASYLYKLVADKPATIDHYLSGKLDLLSSSSFDATYQLTKKITAHKKQFEMSYTEPFDFAKKDKQISISQVFDEWVKAPCKLDEPDLLKAKEDLKSGILDYINQTYSSVNYFFRDRAASDRRLDDMHRMLVAINEAPDIDTLKIKVEDELAPIKKGFFNRSLLEDIIRKQIKALPSNKAEIAAHRRMNNKSVA